MSRVARRWVIPRVGSHHDGCVEGILDGSAIDRGGLWTVPELWKTHRPRFPQARWTAQRTRRPHGPQGTLLRYF